MDLLSHLTAALLLAGGALSLGLIHLLARPGSLVGLLASVLVPGIPAAVLARTGTAGPPWLTGR